VGCDDRFIRLNKNDARGYGGFAARPIWETFYRKVYADKKLGIDRDARFSKPDDLELEMNSADPLNLIDAIPPPAAEGEDQGVGNESDFEIMKTREYIGPESKPVTDDGKPARKDTSDNQPAVKIGDPQRDTVKKKNIFQKIFGKKDKKGN
jgi:penicillin-binding protein 1A